MQVSKLLSRAAIGALVAGTLVATALVALAIGATPASAQEVARAPEGGGGVTGPVRAEIFVILARETEGTIDSALADIPALRRPPFSSFHSMEVLARPEMMLTPDRPVDVPLPNGRALRI